jgi:tetratricopeptide (TPR) repeat protein
MLGHLPLLVRIENAVVACCRYLGKLFWPANRSVFYPRPGSWPVLTALLASLLLRLGRVYEAINQFQETLRHKPDFAEAHNNLAYAFRGQGRLDTYAPESAKRLGVRLSSAAFESTRKVIPIVSHHP